MYHFMWIQKRTYVAQIWFLFSILDVRPCSSLVSAWAHTSTLVAMGIKIPNFSSILARENCRGCICHWVRLLVILSSPLDFLPVDFQLINLMTFWWLLQRQHLNYISTSVHFQEIVTIPITIHSVWDFFLAHSQHFPSLVHFLIYIKWRKKMEWNKNPNEKI